MSNTFKRYIAEAGAATAEPLHWAIDKHVQNGILLKRGRKSVVAIDFDGKNYTVMMDPKERSSMGCQKTSFKDAVEMAQNMLNGTVEGGRVPECPSNIRRWLKHGQDKVEESLKEAEDTWEKATSSIPKDFLEWKQGKTEGEVVLMRKKKMYMRIRKRLPSKQNSDFYQSWIKENPYSLEVFSFAMDRSGSSSLCWEYPDLKSVLKDVDRHKRIDYSANALVLPELPTEMREWLRKGHVNPKAEFVSEAAAHVFKWEVYKKYPNRVSLVLDGRYEVAAIFRNERSLDGKRPYVMEVYSFNHACEFSGLEKTIADAVKRLAKELSSPKQMKDPQMADVEPQEVKIPPMPTKARMWLDAPFVENVLSEKK